MDKNSSQVIEIDNRFFVKFGKGERVLTAWGIAGACHYSVDEKIQSDVDKLKKKGKEPQIRTVTLVK